MRDRRRNAWMLALAAVVFAILRLVTVPAKPSLRLCGFYLLTGRPCPFCGLTRAMFALAKGHWTEAIRFHALSPLVFGAFLLWTLVLLARVIAPARFDLHVAPPVQRQLLAAGAILFAVFGAVRLCLA